MNENYFFKVLFYLVVYCCMRQTSIAQQKQRIGHSQKLLVGAEVKWYPAGWILGPSVSHAIAPNHLLSAGVAVNIANRKDFSGLNDDEKGKAFGGSLGYRFLFTPNKNSFFLGTRVDLWGMKIKWKNKIGTSQETGGTTKITIFQPTAEIGYWIKFKGSKWNLLFSGGGGAEINVKTTGKEVGQGGMWLLGVSTYYEF
jgi:hypothetical protein